MSQIDGAKNSEFSFNTITSFDDHIAKSIPQYELMIESVVRMSDYFKDEKKVVYDVGTSTGKLLKYFKRANNYQGKLVGIDNCSNLLPNSDSGITFINHDLMKPFTFNDACIVYSLYTMQFLPKEYRQAVLQSIYDGLVDGGALFISEKVYCYTGMFQDIFTSSYYDYKRQSFTEKEIWDKERSLRTMLKPNTHDENMQLLMKVGFEQDKITMFYKYFGFEGLVCVK